MTIIDRFDGTYHFLSNFWLVPVIYDGMVYLSVEHAYQAAKTLSLNDRTRIWRAATPGEAKRLGRHLQLREDWDEVKLQVMAFLLVQKFKKGTLLGSMLDATGDAYLMEGNTWGDTFWGVCNGEGCNYLGELLMLIREGNRKPTTKKERSRLDRSYTKCWCGNVAKKGTKFCGAHEPCHRHHVIDCEECSSDY